MVDGLILMMFLLFRTFRKTLHVATNTEETILDILYERVNKYYYYITVHNEVVKVMFLQVCVCPQGGLLPGGSVCSGGCLVQGGLLPGVGIPACTEADPPGETATAADGMHPTGMHSCSKLLFRRKWHPSLL